MKSLTGIQKGQISFSLAKGMCLKQVSSYLCPLVLHLSPTATPQKPFDLEPLRLALLYCMHQWILLLERETHATQLFLLNRLRVRIINLKKNPKYIVIWN